jgi:glycerate kinase
MRVLVAPDKFRGTLSAEEAAAAIERGWLSARPDDVVDRVPLADGGEGTLDVLVDAYGGRRRPTTVSGPLGGPVEAEYGLVPRGEDLVAIVEMSRASGLQLVPEDRRDVLRATTRGTGELILAACADASELIVCIGGSATNDGGAGMAQALGVRLVGVDGLELGPGGAALEAVDRIDVSRIDPTVRRAHILVACDVDNSLLGPNGASAVYGPQKGATPRDVELLDRALGCFADAIERDLGIDVRDVPGAGAAGGLGAGLVAFLAAELRPGVDVVMEAVGFGGHLAEADLVITGEGKLDEQSWRGKVPAGVRARALEAGLETIVLCGRSEANATPDDTRVESLVEWFGEDRAMNDAAPALEELAALVAPRTREGGPQPPMR